MKAIKISKKYKMKTKNKRSIAVKMELQAECLNEEEMQEALHFIALKSRQFYLKAANKINSKLS